MRLDTKTCVSKRQNIKILTIHLLNEGIGEKQGGYGLPLSWGSGGARLFMTRGSCLMMKADREVTTSEHYCLHYSTTARFTSPSPHIAHSLMLPQILHRIPRQLSFY
jgi:hypothetical protein